MKLLEYRLAALIAPSFRFVGEGEVVEETTTETPPPTEKKPPASKVPLTPEQQAFVNSLLAEERRKGKAIADKSIIELETARNQAGTTQAERDRLSEQIEELRNQYTTEKELTAKEQKKAEKKIADEKKALETEAAKWKSLFFESSIHRSIIDAASIPGQKAHNPTHVVNELAPKTRLVEELDEENRPTGKWIAKAKIQTVKDGKPQVLEMTVTEAVKFLSEQDEHAPLFDSGMVGGLGGNNKPSRRGETRNPNDPPSDPAEYRAWRIANPTAVGATTRRTTK